MGRHKKVTIEQLVPPLQYCRCEHSTNVHAIGTRFYERCHLTGCICRLFVPVDNAKEMAADGTYPRP